MKSSQVTVYLAGVLAGALSSPASGFVPGRVQLGHENLQHRSDIFLRNNDISQIKIRSRPDLSMALIPPGISGKALPAIKYALTGASYPKALGALAAVASAVVVPLTLYRQAYSFSVGYGFSIAAMSVSLLSSFSISFLDSSTPATLIPTLSMLYGLRLATFLLVREFTVPSKQKQVKEFDRSSRLSRIPFATFVAGFYAMMTSPVLSALRGSALVSDAWKAVQWIGVLVAGMGLLVEAIADHHKYIVKMQNSNGFMGPTDGLYALCRHPNYLGEVLFWLGLYVAGLPTFGGSVATWIPATLGLYGIVSIMTKATERLDKKQGEKYADDAVYSTWRDGTKAALVPFISG